VGYSTRERYPGAKGDHNTVRRSNLINKGTVLQYPTRMSRAGVVTSIGSTNSPAIARQCEVMIRAELNQGSSVNQMGTAGERAGCRSTSNIALVKDWGKAQA